MSNTPEPTRTSAGPAFEGRLLAHPDDDVVDQGARFDIDTILSRRGILAFAGIGAGAFALVACTQQPADCMSSASTATQSPTGSSSTGAIDVSSQIPDETAGPYPGDGSNGPDILEQSGIVRTDLRSNLDGSATADGVPLTFSLQIVDMANGNVPFAGAAVYAWHCDADGNYSMYSSGIENYTYLRGVQVADCKGVVTVTSIYPACYSGRWPHIHLEVYPTVNDITDSTKAISTSQLALPDDTNRLVFADSRYSQSVRNYSQVSLATDNVFSDDRGASQLPTISGDNSSGYIASLVVGVDTRTMPTASSAPASGGQVDPGQGQGGPGGPGGGQGGGPAGR